MRAHATSSWASAADRAAGTAVRTAVRLVKALAALALAMACASALAQRCTFEAEPNDQPHQATRVTGEGPDSGALPSWSRLPTACLAGELGEGDVDMFFWTVDDLAAVHSWQLEVEGPAGRLTAAQVHRVALEGDVVTEASRLLRVESLGQAAASEPFLLPPGDYVVVVVGSGAEGGWVVNLRPRDLASGGRAHVDGRSYPGEFDVYLPAGRPTDVRVAISEEDAGRLWRLELLATLGTGATAALVGPSGPVTDLRYEGRGAVSRSGLGLEAGDHVVSLTGDVEGGFVRVALLRGPKRSDGAEVEPNDAFGTATALPLGGEVRGTLDGTDVFRIDVDEPGVWDLSVEAADEVETRLWAGNREAELQRRRGTGVSSPGLHLAPGTYSLWLSGRGGDYVVRLAQASPAADGFEREPNDFPAGASPFGEAAQARGLLHPQDVDVFELVVEGEAQAYRLQAVGDAVTELSVLEPDGSVRARVRGERRLRLDGIALLPGRHLVAVRGDGEYALRALAQGPVPADTPPAEPADAPLEAAPPAEEPVDPQAPVALPTPPPGMLEFEPNDDDSRANRLMFGQVHVGRLGSSDDTDHYRFHLGNDQYVRIEMVPAAGDVVPLVYLERSRLDPMAEGPSFVAEVWLPAGDHAVELRTPTGDAPPSGGWYQLRLAQLGPFYLPDDGEAPPLEVGLTLENDEAAAYWHEGQRLTGVATVTNRGPEPASTVITAAASDVRVTAAVEGPIQVPPGATAEVPVVLELPADMRDDAPLLVQVAAEAAGTRAVAAAEVALACEAAPVSPFTYWPLPAELVGLPNALLAGLGAAPVGEGDDSYSRLVDDRVAISRGARLRPDSPPTFDLPGDRPVTLIGATFHPQSQAGSTDLLRGFRIETSLDGQTWTEAYSGELAAARVEQAFAFPEPASARYARLVPLSSLKGAGDSWLGEWGLVAAEAELASGLDIADPAVGGHVAWTSPVLDGRGSTALTLEDDARRVNVSGRDAFTIVVGFQHGRAARVAAIEWRDSPRASEGDGLLGDVRVSVSVSGAGGPWTEVGSLAFAGERPGSARLELDEPVWARYVRLDAGVPEGARSVFAPDEVSVYEAEAGGGYLSILGSWGIMSPRGPYELGQTSSAPAGEEVDPGDTPETAARLEPGAPFRGTVAVAEDVDWLAFTVPEGTNHVTLRLEGDPSVGYVYSLTDAAGAPVAVRATQDGDAIVLEAFVEPGTYHLVLEEPKRTVVFSWDTSGSVSPFVPVTYSSLASFAAGVDGEREAVQLLAFDDPSPRWLLPFWSSDPTRVQRALVEFARDADSSNSELALVMAVEALAGRAGTKAVLLVTDAETSGEDLTPRLWEALQRVRPRVFTFEVSSGGNDGPQDLMQDWALVNGGAYAMPAGVGDFDAAFARASCLLRRPKRYNVSLDLAYVAPPGPGTLSVLQGGETGGGAVHVIFDASGSMGQPLPNGEQRIAAAKRALEDLIGTSLAEGTPFSLRAFGHVAPNSCETRLEVRLGPLVREEALDVVSAIQPKLLSQTAIADSLLAAVNDLARATGPRTVILVTDGVESCGGDPAAAAEELRAAGPTSIAIVSLALDPEGLAAFEELAERIGATYVDVSSFDEAVAAIQEALLPGFEVHAATGLVATGRVGDTVELPMGVYEVRVLTSPVQVFEGVEVPGDGHVDLVVGGP